jgi:5-formyltetrahydrofolate cyclo-ligase
MTAPASPDERRKLIWARVYHDLIRHAIPDSRFNYDFLSFTPDFRGSAAAVDRVLELPCYQNARTLLVTSDNSLERLRFQALKDGKKVLVGTYRLRRGFVLLDPARIVEENFEIAACLDGMEKPGMGRGLSLVQLRDEGLNIDMCATGGLAFNERGVTIYEGSALFEVQWALLQDIKVLGMSARVVAVAHSCQVVDEASLGLEETKSTNSGEVQCDFVVTPATIYEVMAASKPTTGINFDTVDPEALNNIPPLQELKGIRTMEQIMTKGGFSQEKDVVEEPPKAPTAEEQMGIDMVAKLMKGYKA